MKHKQVFNSIGFKIGIVFVIFGALLVALLMISNNYAIQVVRNQVAQSNKNLLDLYMNQLDRNMEETDKYLYNLIAFNSDMISLEHSESENNYAYNMAKIQILNLLSNDIENYKSIDLFFVYSVANQDLLMTQGFGSSYTERENTRNDIASILQDETQVGQYPNNRWVALQVREKYYICHLIKGNGVYIGAWVSVDKMIAPLDLVNFSKKGRILLASKEYTPLNNADFVSGNHIDLSISSSTYNMTGDKTKYLLVAEKSTRGDFSLVAILPDDVILEKLPYFQTIISIIPIVALIILLFYSFLLRKIILIPIFRIISDMKKVKSGDWDVKMDHRATSYEFDLMQDTFDAMISQIHDLKISIYEDQLKLQNAELKHLQLQINPHFFLNSLNVIYQLAQVGNFKLIQEMTQCLVRYFRFMFRTNSTFINLEDELMHIKNYLKIQELRFPGFLTYDITVPDSLLHCKIPPLVIQTFIENTIKHAVTLDEPTHITVSIMHFENDHEPMMKIIIQDTGKGYSKDVLDSIQSEKNIVDEQGEHSGIWNVQRRLHMLYEDKAYVIIYNRQDGGASTEITLPTEPKESGEGTHVPTAHSG